MYPIIILFLLILGTIQEWSLTAQVYHWLEQQNGSTAALFQVILSFSLSAMLGMSLFRRVGIQLLRKAQLQMAQGVVPDRTLAEGLLLVLSAFLLIAPGYLSDGIAVLLLILRKPLATLVLKMVKKKFIKRHVHVTRADGHYTRADGHYTRADGHHTRAGEPHVYVTRVDEHPLIIDVPARDFSEKS